ncbi:MAG: hypothetical protein WAM91_11015 [Candidatus Acidiferrales bacterium]
MAGAKIIFVEGGAIPINGDEEPVFTGLRVEEERNFSGAALNLSLHPTEQK